MKEIEYHRCKDGVIRRYCKCENKKLEDIITGSVKQRIIFNNDEKTWINDGELVHNPENPTIDYFFTREEADFKNIKKLITETPSKENLK